MNIITVPVNKLKGAYFNPTGRITDHAIADLIESMEKEGFHEWQPIYITEKYIIGDGHRRVQAAMKVGIKDIPAIIIKNLTESQIYTMVNGTSHRKTTPNDWFIAHVKGLPLEYVPKYIRRDIIYLQQALGKEEAAKLAIRGRSPGMASIAKMVVRYCGDDSEIFKRKIIVWFEEHGQQYVARRAMDAGINANHLKLAIEENRPIKVYSI